MKKIFTKENVMPVVVLSVICLVVAAFLGGVNMITSPIIEDAKNKEANAALLVVLPEGKSFEEIDLTAEYPAEIKRAHKADAGYVFEVNTRGKDQMTVMCGVDNEGKIVKVKILSEQETPGYKEKVFPFVTGDEGSYNGKDSASLEPELFSGATLTSNGVYNAVKAALGGFAVATGGEIEEEPEETLPRTDDELIALAKELVGEGAELTDVTPDGTTLVKRVYKENSGLGYVAYVFTVSSHYGTVDTENLVYIGNNGAIKSIKKLTWAVSEAAPDGGYNPPGDEKLAEFYEGLNGKNSTTIEEVDLKTGATNTTTSLVESIKEALKVVTELVKKDMPTSEDEVKALAAELIGSTDLSDVTPAGCELVKRIYKDNGGRGYVAYAVAISPNYGTVETETLIYIDNSGKIAGVDRMIWKTSDALWGYVPPTEEEVKAFYDGLIGNDLVSFESDYMGEEPEHVANATTTTKRLNACISEALKSVATIVEGDEAERALLNLKMKNLVPGAEGFEAVELPENAPATVKALYKVVGFDGHVVHLITSTQYVAVETETLVYVANGKVKSIELITWTVGHGIGPGNFASTLVGKNADRLAEVELVTEATGTSMHLRDAVIDALSVAPVDNTPAVVGIVALVLAVIGFAAYAAVPKILRRRKNG